MAHTLGVANSGSGSGSSLGIALNGTTAGRGIVVVTEAYVPGTDLTISSITCTGEANLTLLGSMFVFTLGGYKYNVQLAYLQNITAGGNKTITTTWSGTTSGNSMAMVEFAGGDTAAWLDTSTVTGTGTSNNPNVSIATTRAGGLIVAFEASTNGGLTAGSGYAIFSPVLPNVVWWEEGEYLLDAGSAGTKTSDCTLDASADWAFAAASFKAPAAAGLVIPVLVDEFRHRR